MEKTRKGQAPDGLNINIRVPARPGGVDFYHHIEEHYAITGVVTEDKERASATNGELKKTQPTFHDLAGLGLS